MLTLLAFAVGVYLWMFIHVLLHEAGHVLAAKAVGFAPFSFTVGKGPLLIQRRVGNVRVRIQCLPLFGMVQARLALQGLWWRGAVFAAGGLVVDTLLLAALLKANESSWAKGFFAVLVGYQVFMLAVTLIPMVLSVQGARIPNDGWQILGYLSGSTPRTLRDYEKSTAAYDPAFRLADSVLMRGDVSTMLAMLAAEQELAAGRFAAAVKKYLRAIERATLHPAEKARLLDRIACIPVFHGEKSFVAAAETWARQASALFPNCKTIRGTLGSILVEKGDCAEAVALLMPLTSQDNRQIDRTLASCYLAKAFHRLGNCAEAGKWLAAARSSGGFPAVLSRIESELALA